MNRSRRSIWKLLKRSSFSTPTLVSILKYRKNRTICSKLLSACTLELVRLFSLSRSDVSPHADLYSSARPGKVCVPILASQIDDFNPETVPTVGKLLLELEYRARTGDTTADWSKTSLRPYVELFERHCEAIVKAKTREARGESLVHFPFLFLG